MTRKLSKRNIFYFHLQDLSGIKAIHRIKRVDRVTKFLILTGDKKEEYIYYALKYGVRGLLNKNITKGELFYAINKINNGEMYFGAGFNKERLKEIIYKYDQLRKTNYIYSKAYFTEQERNILYLIGEALSSLEIADKLKVSKRTVDTHRANIMQKLNLKSLPELVRYSVYYSIKNLKNDKLRIQGL